MSRRFGLRPGLFLGAWIAFAPSVPAHETFQDCPDCPRMVVIPGGSFTMGSPADEPLRFKLEGPQRHLNIPAFAISETEVTRKQYAAFVADTKRPAGGGCFTFGFSSLTEATVDSSASWRNPAFEQTEDHPVVCVSWQDAKDYAAWLTRKTGQTYRLPSEAEWEYAARAGATSTFIWGEDPDRGCVHVSGGDQSLVRALPAYQELVFNSFRGGETSARVLHCDDGSPFTSAVARYKPNAFGLRDMIGNVWSGWRTAGRSHFPRTVAHRLRKPVTAASGAAPGTTGPESYALPGAAASEATREETTGVFASREHCRLARMQPPLSDRRANAADSARPGKHARTDRVTRATTQSDGEHFEPSDKLRAVVRPRTLNPSKSCATRRRQNVAAPRSESSAPRGVLR